MLGISKLEVPGDAYCYDRLEH